MEFLVQIELSMPLDESVARPLREAELERGRELVESGVIRRIWRIPGRTANVGIWVAADATELHEQLSSLPLFPYMDVRVTALACHPLDP